KLGRRISDNVQSVTTRSRCDSGNRFLERNVSASNERAGIDTDERSATSSQIDPISEAGARARRRVRKHQRIEERRFGQSHAPDVRLRSASAEKNQSIVGLRKNRSRG